MGAARFHHVRLFHAVVVGTIALSVLGLAPASSPISPATAEASSAIQVMSTRAFTDSIGYLHIVGDVKNTSTYWRKYVEIDAIIYNASGSVLKTAFTFTFLDLVGPGLRASFDLLTKRPSGYDHYRLSTSSWTTSLRPMKNLTISKGTPYKDSIGYKHYPGSVRNGNTFTVEYTMVIVTLFDVNGKILNTDFTFTNSYTIPPGATRGFEVLFSGHYKGTYSVRYQVQADRA